MFLFEIKSQLISGFELWKEKKKDSTKSCV